MKRLFVLIAIFILFFNLENKAEYKFKYNLSKPDIKQQLPPVLNEVSGLTDIDSKHVALVQDELGIVFIYDFVNGKIISQYEFEDAGDFEGLTYTGNSIYILRSDGRLTEWKNFLNEDAKFTHHQLNLQTSNNEGLCYDAKHNRILIAAKSKPLIHDFKEQRYIYSYDITTEKLLEKPIYSINTNDIQKLADKLNIKTNTAKGKKIHFNFRPSSLAIHPVTDEIYIISAAEKLILIINRKGELIHLEKLNEELFLKAEGITFLPDGTMIITNEAVDKYPTLLVFKMNK
ncbi:MAG TPA: SdiA-regulated domain-containing protein [Candidatus Kapabacteria bacterium]|nr:SdiA-regulated domain-containing protein [Candidatus Kapabacteria bacterium]